jgi:hypothetical protein
MIDAVVKPGRKVFMKKEREEELTELRQEIRESVRQGNLKSLQKLVQRYFSMLRPVAVEEKNNLDYRFCKQKTGR